MELGPQAADELLKSLVRGGELVREIGHAR